MSEKKAPRVLLADDEMHIRAMMKAALKKLNWEIVDEAKNGQEAIDLYKKHKPDLLLMDLNMPEKTGVTALKEIKAFDPNALVVILTSEAADDNLEKCLELGAANYILKNNPIQGIREMLQDTWEDA
jgi:two-component system chemotaxis response regulator CheY